MSADDGDWVRTTGPSLTGTSGPPGGYPNGGKGFQGSLKFREGIKLGGGCWKQSSEQGVDEMAAPADSKDSALPLCLPTEGYYLHMDPKTFPPGGVARLRSPDIWEQGPLCVHFAFHMFGLSWGAQLRLLLLRGRKHLQPYVLWKHVNTQSPSWMPTTVTVPADHDIPSWVRLRADLEVW